MRIILLPSYWLRKWSAKTYISSRIAMKPALIAIAAAFLLAACANQPAVTQNAPGLLVGFFHGFTAILSLIGSLFLQIRIYEFPNGGFWYDFGFVAGFATSLLALFLAFAARIGGMLT